MEDEELYYEEEYNQVDDSFTEEDEKHIEEAIMERLENERLSYTYKIVSLDGLDVKLQAIENKHYFIEIKGKTMSSYKKY